MQYGRRPTCCWYRLPRRYRLPRWYRLPSWLRTCDHIVRSFASQILVDVRRARSVRRAYTHVQQDLAARAPVPLPLVAVVSNAGIACVNPVELIAMDK